MDSFGATVAFECKVLLTVPGFKKTKRAGIPLLSLFHFNRKFCSCCAQNYSSITGINDLETLKTEAVEKKFPDNELLRKLNTVLKDVELCQKRSTELLSNVESRYDQVTQSLTVTARVQALTRCRLLVTER